MFKVDSSHLSVPQVANAAGQEGRASQLRRHVAHGVVDGGVVEAAALVAQRPPRPRARPAEARAMYLTRRFRHVVSEER